MATTKRRGAERASVPGPSRTAGRLPGAATAAAPIEPPFDLAVFQRQLIDGTHAMLGVEIAPVDPE